MLCSILIVIYFRAAKSSSLDGRSIAIIGGGWSGLSSAYHLVQAGIKNVTIFEASSSLGGFITSVPVNNVTVDVATYAATSAYWKFFQAIIPTKVEFCSFIGNVAVRDGEKRKVESLFEVFGRQIALNLNDSQNVGHAVSDALNRYLEHWVRLMKISFVEGSLLTKRLFPEKPDDNTMRELSTPALTWMRENNFNIFEPVFRIFVDAQAYGPLETTPILYVLSWMTPDVVQKTFQGNPVSIPCAGNESFQTVFDRLLEIIKSNVKVKHLRTVKYVIRSRNTRRPSVCFLKVPCMSFDDIIITSKQSRSKNKVVIYPRLKQESLVEFTIRDLSIRNALFETNRNDTIQPIGHTMYDEDLIKGIGQDGIYRKMHGVLNPKPEGGVKNGISADQDGNRIARLAVRFLYRERDENIRFTENKSKSVRILSSELRKWDNAKWKLIELFSFKNYFERWSSVDVAKGLPWKLAEVQGIGRVYYVGSAACGFESIGHIFDCAEEVVGKLMNSSIITPLKSNIHESLISF